MKNLYPLKLNIPFQKSLVRRKAVLLPLILLSIYQTALCQSYFPGGLGNSNLKLWLTVSDPTTLRKPGGGQAVSGGTVETWQDKSGKGNDAVQMAGVGRPVYKTNQLNGNGSVQFQNTSQNLTGPSDAYQTVMAVRNMPGTGHYQTLFASPANTDFSIRGGGAATTYTDGPNANDWTNLTGATPTEWLNGVQTLNGSSANQIMVAAALNPTNASYSVSSTFTNRGMNTNDNVYEILAYNGTLNTTQRQILENYTAATWGLGALLPAVGYTKYIPTSLTSYNQHLVGIGYTSASDYFLTNPTGGATGSTDGLGFSSGTTATDFLSSPGFLMAAHNGQVASTTNNATLPSVSPSGVGTLSLWNRSWRVEVSGGNSSGTVTLNFNFSDYSGGSVPSLAYTYAIIYNATDGSFYSGSNHIVSTSSTSVTASNVAFTVKASNLATGFYTLVWSTTGILPVVLEEFEASKESNNKAQLQWIVNDQMTSGSFEIQRRNGGSSFSVIGNIEASQVAQSNGSYSFTDNQPAAGLNEYRIRVTGPGGTSIYSSIHSLEFQSTGSLGLHVYPNPVADRLLLTSSNLTGPAQIRLIGLNGVVYRSLTVTSVNGTGIPVSNLPTGIYVIELSCGDQQFRQEILKQ